MSKYLRYQPVISRNNDEHISEDHWLKQFERNLQKGAVQPKSQISLFDQINSVMNGAQPKYPSVQAAVDDMMQRSGLTNYLKTSKEENQDKTKTASENYFQLGLENGQEDLKNQGFGSDIISAICALISPIPITTDAWTQYANGYMQGSKMPEEYRAHEMKRIHAYLRKHAADQNNVFVKHGPEEGSKPDNMPQIVRDVPAVLKTLQNYVRSTRGNLPIPAIIDKVRSIHRADVSEEKLWDDDKFVRLVSQLNLEAKKNNPGNFQDMNNLAVNDRDTADSDVDPSNTDAFNVLMPAKL